jgi:peptidoglycan/xylan/chitin deacetylase (PgdA/CDA1 family)
MNNVKIGNTIMPCTFTCSIDDGHPSDIRMADLLLRHGLNGTFYIPIRNREGFPVMSQSKMRDLSDFFEIGSHTYDHCYLTKVSPSLARYQIHEGKQRLEDIIGKSVSGFCYPGGKYHKIHADMVKRAGFEYARTTTNLYFNAGKNPYEMPTTCQFYPHKKSVYVRNFVRSMHWRDRQAGLFSVLQEDNWLKRMYSLFEHAHRDGGIFHLWGHSHNFDDLDLWGELDTFLAHVANNVDSQQCLNNGQLAAKVRHH